jgi:hypothetical protein
LNQRSLKTGCRDAVGFFNICTPIVSSRTRKRVCDILLTVTRIIIVNMLTWAFILKKQNIPSRGKEQLKKLIDKFRSKFDFFCKSVPKEGTKPILQAIGQEPIKITGLISPNSERIAQQSQ